MSGGRTYLDWNATAPLRPEARAAMVAALDVAGNPSSPHAEGRRARAIVEDAREQVAALVGARPAEVVFTSGGTEANNAVVSACWGTIVLTRVEHDSVFAAAARAVAPVAELGVGGDGRLPVAAVSTAAVGVGRRATLFSVQVANNETGVLQPVSELAGAAKARGFSVHSDAVQAAGRIHIDLRALGVDYLTLSAHKIGGPKGVGAVVAREGAELPALLAGGGQERRRRAGTENVPAIAGFGAAAEAAQADLASVGRVGVLRDQLEKELLSITPDAVVIGSDAARLPNTTNVALRGASAETLVIAFDLAGVAVSAGAACSSGKVGPSRVLEAMGIEPALARSAIRVSLGPTTTERDVVAFLRVWSTVSTRARERAVA